jgi:hypothetical protein
VTATEVNPPKVSEVAPSATPVVPIVTELFAKLAFGIAVLIALEGMLMVVLAAAVS